MKKCTNNNYIIFLYNNTRKKTITILYTTKSKGILQGILQHIFVDANFFLPSEKNLVSASKLEYFAKAFFYCDEEVPYSEELD